MKLSRRRFAAAAAGSAAAVAQTVPPAAAPDPDQAAKDLNKRNADALSRAPLPLATEPAFQFKA